MHPVETWKTQNKTKKNVTYNLTYWEEISINILAFFFYQFF